MLVKGGIFLRQSNYIELVRDAIHLGELIHVGHTRSAEWHSLSVIIAFAGTLITNSVESDAL